MSTHRVNEQITSPKVRLIGPAGEQVGIVSLMSAQDLAYDAGLDLVEVAATASPPVCKIIDYGKLRFAQDQKAKEARKHAPPSNKEVRFRVRIDQHDYETKLHQLEKFLATGHPCKVSVQLRGREQSRPEMGVHLLEKVRGDVSVEGVSSTPPSRDGKTLTLLLKPSHIPAHA